MIARDSINNGIKDVLLNIDQVLSTEIEEIDSILDWVYKNKPKTTWAEGIYTLLLRSDTKRYKTIDQRCDLTEVLDIKETKINEIVNNIVEKTPIILENTKIESNSSPNTKKLYQMKSIDLLRKNITDN